MTEDLKANKPLGEPNVVDPHTAPVQFVDWIVTSGVGPAPSIVNIALAAIDHVKPDPTEAAFAIMQCRLRMSAVTAQNIVTALQRALDAMKPPAPDQTVN